MSNGITRSASRKSVESSANGTGGPKQVPLTCTGHTRPVVDLHFSGFTQNGDFFLISGCKDSIPILRRGDTGDWVGNFQGHKGAVWASRLSKDASISVTGSADFTAKVWNNVQGTALVTLQHQHVVRAVDISDDARYVLTGGYEKKLRVFDLQSPTPETPIRVMEGCQDEIKSVLLDSAHGLVFNGDAKELKVWDLRDSRQVSSRVFDHDVTSLKFSWDKSKIICTGGKKVYFYNSVTAALEYEFDVKVDVSSASLHPDGSRFVIGGSSDLWARFTRVIMDPSTVSVTVQMDNYMLLEAKMEPLDCGKPILERNMGCGRELNKFLEEFVRNERIFEYYSFDIMHNNTPTNTNPIPNQELEYQNNILGDPISSPRNIPTTRVTANVNDDVMGTASDRSKKNFEGISK
ncbi:hypothetical protein HK096_010884 [Nowakowskiella sp. JEL0078]|nr:hypothetical protein HK096_010884 [Nowakowskiella sp. JEL0078]